MGSKEHFHKTSMILGKVGITVATIEPDLPYHLRIIAQGCKTSVFILDVMGGHDDILGHFIKVGIITTVRADHPHGQIARQKFTLNSMSSVVSDLFHPAPLEDDWSPFNIIDCSNRLGLLCRVYRAL